MGVDIVTFGCRLNAVESEAMRAAALAEGREDLVIVNSCAVTAEATRRARQAVRRLRRERPGATIVVTGCAAQIEPERFAAMPEVDRVLGNGEKTRPGVWAAGPAAPGFGVEPVAKIAVGDIMALRETASHLAGGVTEDRTRAFLQVQTGCDHRCTFCVIPFGRGNSRSVPMGALVDEVRRLAEVGCGEVVLTGVDLTSYGRDLPGAPTLGRLVRAILRHAPSLPRLRLSSIDAVEADDDLLRALGEEPRLMPHLHLSLQAGDDLVLKRMRRRHSRGEAIRFCADLRALRPDIVLGADLIAGFPTETEAQFQRSLDLVDECGLTNLHVFPYSPRPGTPAARMPQTPPEVARERARRLIAKGNAAFGRHLDGEVGRVRRVLTERGGTGRTEGFTPVRVEGAARGSIVEVRIAGHDGRRLIAGEVRTPLAREAAA